MNRISTSISDNVDICLEEISKYIQADLKTAVHLKSGNLLDEPSSMTSQSKLAIALPLIIVPALTVCSSGDNRDTAPLGLEEQMATASSHDSVENSICKSSQGVNLIYWL